MQWWKKQTKESMTYETIIIINITELWKVSLEFLKLYHYIHFLISNVK